MIDDVSEHACRLQSPCSYQATLIQLMCCCRTRRCLQQHKLLMRCAETETMCLCDSPVMSESVPQTLPDLKEEKQKESAHAPN